SRHIRAQTPARIWSRTDAPAPARARSCRSIRLRSDRCGEGAAPINQPLHTQDAEKGIEQRARHSTAENEHRDVHNIDSEPDQPVFEQLLIEHPLAADAESRRR